MTLAKMEGAPTVPDMLYVIVGLVVGLAIALGPLGFLQSPFDSLAGFFVGATADLLAATLGELGELSNTTQLVTVLSVVLSTVIPGVVALGLVLLSRAAKKVRQNVSVIVVALALVSFMFVPWEVSLGLTVVALVFGVASSLASGVLVVLPLVALATILGVRYGVLLWNGESPEVAQGAQTLAALIGDPDGTIPWKLALTVVGLAPFAWAVTAAFKSIKK